MAYPPNSRVIRTMCSGRVNPEFVWYCFQKGASVVLVSGELIRNHPLYPVALVLVLLGAFTKSAQFPFHFWLPHAMSAPTPVSAYLHSATMVKAGVFLIARLFPALSGTELWVVVVSTTGLVTLLFGAYTALFKHDLKGLLAYSTISHLGLMTNPRALDEVERALAPRAGRLVSPADLG